MANLIIKPTSGGSLILQDEGGSAAISVAAAGTTTFAENTTLSGTANNLGTVTAATINGGSIGSAVTGFSGIKNSQMWWVTTGWTGSTDPMKNWEAQHGVGAGSIGSSMTESSGIFTFPSTGIWLIQFWVNFRTSSAIGSNYNYVKMWSTTDGGTSWNNCAIAYDILVGAQSDGNITPMCQFLMDVTSTTTHKVKCGAYVANSSATVYGNTNINHTGANFQRIGDT